MISIGLIGLKKEHTLENESILTDTQREREGILPVQENRSEMFKISSFFAMEDLLFFYLMD